MREVGRATVLAVAVLAGASCDQAIGPCNAMASSCALSVALERDAWEAGAYTIRVSADGEPVACTFTVPIDDEAAPDCTGRSAGFNPFGEPGWPLPSETDAPETLYVFGSPAEVHLIIEREGIELGRATFTPRYEVTEPNGEGCGFCENAGETLAF